VQAIASVYIHMVYSATVSLRMSIEEQIQ